MRNELQGWTTRKLQLERQFSALSIILVLLISMLYNGAFSPPGGFVVTTVAISDKVGTSKNRLSNEQPGIVFFYCSSVGLAFAVLGMLFVLVYTLFPTMEGQVTKAIDTFTAYVMDADAGMLGIADDDPVSITYQDAIINNITKTMNLFPMKYFIRAERRSLKLQKAWPVDHKALFTEVLEFYRKCLPGELEICTYLQQAVTSFVFVALVATLGAYISALLTPFTFTFLGPPILMLCLIFIGTMIPLVILWRLHDFDHGARRHYDRGVEPIKLVFTG